MLVLCKVNTWWIIPRIVSKQFHPSYKWINPTYPTKITGDLLPIDDPPGINAPPNTKWFALEMPEGVGFLKPSKLAEHLHKPN